MKSPRVLIVTCLLTASLALATSAAADEPALHVTIDPHTSWGQWDGWGTSLCWWANLFGDRDDLADLGFSLKTVALNGENLPGLGLTIVRYNPGACSWNPVNGASMVLSPHIPRAHQMAGFWLDGESDDPQSSSWDWTLDQKQRQMMLKSRDRGANFFEMFSNSPMWWMLLNHNPCGPDKAGQDNLSPQHDRDDAIYLATIAKYATDHWGISFNTVEAFNEPSAHWWTSDDRQEACSFTPKLQAQIIPMLRQELDRRGLQQTQIAASDESFYYEAIRTWKSFSPAVRADVWKINVHGYEGLKEEPRQTLFKAAAGKKIWLSEYDNNDATGMSVAHDLNLDFHRLHPTGYCTWQLVGSGGWGLISDDSREKTVGKPNPKYFVMAHYSRHIRPGMTILATDESDTVAAYDAKAQKLVLVLLNRGAARQADYDLSKFTKASGPISRWLTEITEQTRYQPQPDTALDAKHLHLSLPANSIQTVEIQGVEI